MILYTSCSWLLECHIHDVALSSVSRIACFKECAQYAIIITVTTIGDHLLPNQVFSPFLVFVTMDYQFTLLVSVKYRNHKKV